MSREYRVRYQALNGEWYWSLPTTDKDVADGIVRRWKELKLPAELYTREATDWEKL